MPNRSRLLHATLIFLGVLLTSPAAFAQEAQPGDTCDPAEEHRFQHVGGPENPGTGYVLVCDGDEWKLVTEWDTGSGQSLFQVGNDPDPCTDDKTGRLRYSGSGASPWEYCDGSDWGPLVSGSLPDCNTDEFLIMSSTGWVCYTGFPPGGTDASPDDFLFPFPSVTNAVPNSTVTSSIKQITGIDTAATVLIEGPGSPEFRICEDSACEDAISNWSSGFDTILYGRYIQIRAAASGTYLGEVVTEVTVGTATASWSVTTSDGSRTVFATSETYQGNIGGVNGANNKCNSLAASAGLSGTFQAWLVGDSGIYDTQAPSFRFEQSAYPYRTPDGRLVANNWGDLTDGTLQNPIDRNEYGNQINGEVWTNVRTNALQSSESCGTDWNSLAGSGYVGLASATNADWTQSRQRDCQDYENRLYCFQE